MTGGSQANDRLDLDGAIAMCDVCGRIRNTNPTAKGLGRMLQCPDCGRRTSHTCIGDKRSNHWLDYDRKKTASDIAKVRKLEETLARMGVSVTRKEIPSDAKRGPVLVSVSVRRRKATINIDLTLEAQAVALERAFLVFMGQEPNGFANDWDAGDFFTNSDRDLIKLPVES